MEHEGESKQDLFRDQDHETLEVAFFLANHDYPRFMNLEVVLEVHLVKVFDNRKSLFFLGSWPVLISDISLQCTASLRCSFSHVLSWR